MERAISATRLAWLFRFLIATSGCYCWRVCSTKRSIPTCCLAAGGWTTDETACDWLAHLSGNDPQPR